MKFFPGFKGEGERIVSWGEARLIKFLDGKMVREESRRRIGRKLRNGSRC
jgi:hypothetical protein